MPELTEGQHKAEYLVTEANGTLSRDAVTVLSGQNLQPGHVLGKVAVGTATGAAVSGNTGNGAISAVSAGSTAKSGVYTAICIEPASNGGTFEVEDPDGVIVGTAVVGTPFAGPVNFTIATAQPISWRATVSRSRSRLAPANTRNTTPPTRMVRKPPWRSCSMP
jgi:hypothetical protein